MFKGNKENGICKSSADITGNNRAHTAVISKADPEYSAAGEAQCLTSSHQRTVLAEFSGELEGERKQLRVSHCFPYSNELLY